MVEQCILGMVSSSARRPLVPHAIVSVQPEKVNLVKVLEGPIHQPERELLAIQGEKCERTLI